MRQPPTVAPVPSSTGQHRAGEALNESLGAIDQNFKVRQLNILDYVGSDNTADARTVGNADGDSVALERTQFCSHDGAHGVCDNGLAVSCGREEDLLQRKVREGQGDEGGGLQMM